MKSSLFIMIIALALSLFIIGGCRSRAEETKEVKRPQVAGVTVEAVTLSQADEYLETAGTVKAKTVSLIASRMMGSITSIKVKEGDRVNAGHLLATVDDSDVAQRVRAAEKAVEAAAQQRSLADVTYKRYKNLYDDKALSGQELDQIETRNKVSDMEYERAKAMLQEARAYHAFTRITAPVPGLVTEKKADLGSTAVPGIPLFTIEDTSGYRIEASIDEKQAGKIKPGLEVTVFIESLNREIRGKVTEVVPAVDAATRTQLIKIAISSEGLRSGSYGKVSIPAGKKEAILVNRKAVVEKGQLTGIYAVDANSIITYRLIRTGKAYGDKVEVLSGLNPNDKVIVDRVDLAIDGGILAAVQSGR
ncbi:MAG: efflux RND transporter periplasmic adaptor subunit [Nitrospirae bacterium]|nr:efflux RND transporter periplasmic adaptor subunit [Nitrospirota bacterium]